MDRQYYLDLAARGLRMPVGTDLVLREKTDHDAIILDGPRLGAVLEESARRYRTPLAVPLMDLTIEKQTLLRALGVSESQADTYHFSSCPPDDASTRLEADNQRPSTPRLQAHIDSIAYVASKKDLVPVGMCIGPFSLMTKLLADPITPVYLAGTGITAGEDEEVRSVERTLELATRTIEYSIEKQVAAGAKAMFVAEPAANLAYISPKQLEAGADIFDRYVMVHNQRIRGLMEARGVDLIFHCCGELTDEMVRKFASLDPAILSLGSSRKLWEDARLVGRRTVLYGNLPTKKFYSDQLVTVQQAEQMACDLLKRMKEVGHPFILGSECDVLSVPGSEQTIRRKVAAFLNVKC